MNQGEQGWRQVKKALHELRAVAVRREASPLGGTHKGSDLVELFTRHCELSLSPDDAYSQPGNLDGFDRYALELQGRGTLTSNVFYAQLL